MKWLCSLYFHRWRYADSDTYWARQQCARCGQIREFRYTPYD